MMATDQPRATLMLRKCAYSRNPWRILVCWANGQEQALTDFGFPRRRDAVPFLRRLEALRAPWHLPFQDWPADLRTHAAAIHADTPMAQELMVLTARGHVPPGA